jgi:hypothetical protein
MLAAPCTAAAKREQTGSIHLQIEDVRNTTITLFVGQLLLAIVLIFQKVFHCG